MNRIVAAVAVSLALGSTALAEDGKALFAQKCASCHGPDGKGKTAMGLKLGARDLTTVKEPEADVAKVITNGKPPKMVAYKEKLTPEQIQVLARYVKNGLK
jgi:cbb3-type cytochrome c oxidase subunit III